MKMIYLATPYSSDGILGSLLMVYRCRTVTRVAAILMGKGNNVFSPITHSHYIACAGNLPQLDSEFWLEMDKWYVDRCDEVNVLMVEGWRISKGVNREIHWALEQGKVVVGVNTHGERTLLIRSVPCPELI